MTVSPGRAPFSVSTRSASRHSARSALRPRSGCVPACAPRPRATSVRLAWALRWYTRSPFSRAHSSTRQASAPRMRSNPSGGPVGRVSSSETLTKSMAAKWRSPAASASSAAKPSSRPPFMSATPGPWARPSRTAKPICAAEPAGNTVSWWPSRTIRGPLPPLSLAVTVLPPAPGISSTSQPISSAHSASSPATFSRPAGASTPLSISTSCSSRSSHRGSRRRASSAAAAAAAAALSTGVTGSVVIEGPRPARWRSNPREARRRWRRPASRSPPPAPGRRSRAARLPRRPALR